MRRVTWIAALGTLMTVAAHAGALQYPDQGKILATGGVSEVEGAGGGGLTPWAVITGYGTSDSFGANAHYTFVHLSDQSLYSYGVAASAFDRVEISYAKETYRFRTGLLSTGGESSIDADVFGIKVKLLGDIVYDQDRWYPQVAVGAMYKKNKGLDIPVLGVRDFSPINLGAKHDSGIDYYLSATKLYLSESILANLTLRATKANQFGLLGFGGERSDNYHVEPEISLAYLFTRKLAAGAEYRAKPHNLNIDSESGAYDFFVAYFPSTNVSLTAAYVDLGTIGKQIAEAFSATSYGGRQRGPYVSIQAGF
jgi:Protein of unknown function (DUF3034)